MTDDAPGDRTAVQRISDCLDGFATGLDLTKATAWTIVEAVVADLPGRDDEALAMEARKRMLKAAL